jgi:diamine N-acetyltransferase
MSQFGAPDRRSRGLDLTRVNNNAATFAVDMQPLPSAPSIRRATIADAAALADIGRRTYSDTFAELSTPDDLAAFLHATYSTELQARELADPALTYFVVESGDQLVAFALIRRHSVSQFVDDPSAIELQRFYVDRSCHGTGVAHQLMTACVDYAASYSAETASLNRTRERFAFTASTASAPWGISSSASALTISEIS